MQRYFEPKTVWRVAFAAALLAVAAHTWTLGRILLGRFSCPLDLDYLENAHVYHAWRIAHRLPLYADPASGFATFPYPPLYWVALDAAAAIFGFTDQAGRAVSIGSFVFMTATLAWQVVRSAPSRVTGAAFGAIAVGGICAGYAGSDGSYDWTRADTLAIFLTVAAAALMRDGRLSLRRAWAVGAILTLSVYTKQSGAVFAAWLIAFAFWRDRSGGLWLAAATGLLCALPLVVLEATTHGWFLRWIFYPSHQPLQPWWEAFGALGNFVLRAPFLPFLPWLAVALRRRSRLRPATAMWAGLLLVAVAGGATASVKQFCCRNVWIPELVLVWPAALMMAGDWLVAAEGRDAPGWPKAEAVLMGASSALLLALVYDASPFLPGPDRWQAATRLEDIARSLDGGVVVTTAPMVGVDAGGPVEQPVLSTYEDARSGGLAVDYVAALLASGARWVLTTDRYVGTDRAPEARMAAYYARERAFDFDVHSLASWDRPKNVVLWRRTAP
jgi:hypothetical protein